MPNEHVEIPVSVAAQLLGVSNGHVTQLMRAGVIAARQFPSGDWVTTPSLLNAYRETARQGRGRALKSDVAWGVLWELSGLRAEWLSRATLARIRRNLAAWSAADISHAVSGRTRAYRYESSPDNASAEVIVTGRTVAGELGIGFKNAPATIVGYPKEGHPAEFARDHRLTPNYRGKCVIFSNTLPIAFNGSRMPSGVIAADLASSLDHEERRRGWKALDHVWDQWASTYGASFARKGGARRPRTPSRAA